MAGGARDARRSRFAAWRAAVHALRGQVVALALAARHPDTPWPARLLIMAVVAYAVSPIDLIPDFVPVFGLLDDLVLVPCGLWLAVRLLPPAVWADCRARADAATRLAPSRWAAAVVVSIWLLCAVAGMAWLAGRRG